MPRPSGSSSTISTLPGVAAIRSAAIKSCTASSVREIVGNRASAGAAVSGFDAMPVEPTSGRRKKTAKGAKAVKRRRDDGSGSRPPTGRPRRSHDPHDRDRRQDDREHGAERDDVVEEIGVEPGEDAAAVDDGEQRLEPEAEDSADDERDEERPRVDFERAGGEHRECERKRGRDEIEDREGGRAPFAKAAAGLAEPPPGDPA